LSHQQKLIYRIIIQETEAKSVICIHCENQNYKGRYETFSYWESFKTQRLKANSDLVLEDGYLNGNKSTAE